MAHRLLSEPFGKAITVVKRPLQQPAVSMFVSIALAYKSWLVWCVRKTPLAG